MVHRSAPKVSTTDENTDISNCRIHSHITDATADERRQYKITYAVSDDDSMDWEEQDDDNGRSGCEYDRRSPCCSSVTIDLTDDDDDSVVGVLAIEANNKGATKRVSFGSVITREYSVTVGDHSSLTSQCGITLDWGHTAESRQPVSQVEWQRFFIRRSSGRRRMTAADRRRRIVAVTGCLPSDVRAAEYNIALQRYNQELVDTLKQQDTDNSGRIYFHQQNLEVLYQAFRDVQYRQQEQEYAAKQYQNQQQQRCSYQRPESAVVVV